ncbi:MAG: hypothetical protein ABR605_08845 [Desulfurivibrionaceae bacterium]
MELLKILILFLLLPLPARLCRSELFLFSGLVALRPDQQSMGIEKLLFSLFKVEDEIFNRVHPFMGITGSVVDYPFITMT